MSAADNLMHALDVLEWTAWGAKPHQEQREDVAAMTQSEKERLARVAFAERARRHGVAP